jgi:hypothetical protein
MTTATLDSRQEEYLQLLDRLGDRDRLLVVQGIKRIVARQDETQNTPFIQSLLGRTFSQEEQIDLELDALRAYFQRRRELLKDSLTATQVANLLATSRQTPHDRLKSQTLIGILDNGSYRFPIWQFDPEGADGVVNGLPMVLKGLQVSDFAKLNWLTRPNPVLDGLTPIVALKHGQLERVVQEARGISDR